MPFLTQPKGQEMSKKLWEETKTELASYAKVPEVLAA